ncbi:MAG: Flp pilus assembly protein CpaB [Mariniblastus sp.]
MKSKSFMLMIVSMGFGLVAAIGISQVMVGKSKPQQPAIQMSPILVAKTDVDIKSELTADNVTIENWPASIVPENAATKIEDITENEMVTISRLSKGMPIVKSAILPKSQVGLISIPEGYKVVAIKVNGDDTIAGLLSPGDRVDVIGLFKRSDRSQTTRTFLKGLRVFSIGNRTSAAIERSKGGTGSAIVGVLVTEKQSEEIYFVQRTGQIKLALRGEETDSDTEPQSILDIMETAQEAAEPEDTGPRMIVDMNLKPGSQGSMIVWTGPDAEKINFQSGDVPQRNGASERRMPDELMDEAMGDSDGSEGIERGLQQDQYLSR